MTDKRFVIKLSAIVTDSFVIIDKEMNYTKKIKHWKKAIRSYIQKYLKCELILH